MPIANGNGVPIIAIEIYVVDAIFLVYSFFRLQLETNHFYFIFRN